MNSLNQASTRFDFDALIDRTNTDSAKWGRLSPGVLPMFVADMDFRAPEPIIQALRDRVDHGLFGYSRLSPELVAAIQGYLGRHFAWSVDDPAIVPLPGVISGFNLALKALTEPGDGILVQTPAYPPILNCSSHHRLQRHDVPFVDGSSRFEIDWEAFETAAAQTRVFMLCNPHNPTGRVFDRSELERMAEICLRHGITIVSDEIHCDIVLGSHRHTPIASLGPEVERNTITLMAPSKTFGLPGLKASFAVVTDEALRKRLEESRGGLVPAVNLLGQVAMTAAYRDCDDWLAALLEYLEGNVQLLSRFVQDRLPGVRYKPPEGTYLAWLDCRDARLPDDDARTFFLDEAKVGLSNGLDFGTPGKGFVRISFASPRSLLAEALERMSAALTSR